MGSHLSIAEALAQLEAQVAHHKQQLEPHEAQEAHHARQQAFHAEQSWSTRPSTARRSRASRPSRPYPRTSAQFSRTSSQPLLPRPRWTRRSPRAAGDG
jgi:hypothetical protein